jgi:uncharacterized protein
VGGWRSLLRGAAGRQLGAALMFATRFPIGLGFRPEIEHEIFAHREEIDFLELYSERYFQRRRAGELETLKAAFPVVLHGLTLSIGTAEPLDPVYVEELRLLTAQCGPVWVSDHLAVTRAGNIDIGHLAPVAFTTERMIDVAAKAEMLRRSLDTPFLLENITYYFPAADDEMSEAEFIRGLVERAPCDLLLDVTNVFANGSNHGYDPYAFIHSMPPDRIRQLHIGGLAFRDGWWVDSHADPVPDEVWKLLRFVCNRIPSAGIVLERDKDFTDFNLLLEELRLARRHAEAA